MNALHRDLKHLVPLVEGLGAAQAAADPHRQRLHIQPPVGWLNDPNGLCKVGDTYHVFYQYGPFDPAGGVKHWGHVTSTDLLHWQHQPVMLCPDQPFDCHGNYSGSALCEDGQLWLFYTGNVKLPGRYDYIHEGREHNLCLAVSRDCLTADTKECRMRNADYPEGLSCHVRDPKVWRQDGVYYMVLGARTREDRGECTLGDYHPLDGGFDYYAPQSFADGERRLQFGWMGMPDAPYHNPTVEHGWQHCLTFPRQLCRKGELLVQAPADELKALRGAPAALADGAEMAVSPCFELEAATGGSFALTVAGGLTFACDEAGSTASLWFAGEALGAGRDRRTMELQTPCRSVRVLADASSLEIFVNGGEAVFTTRYYPEPGPVALRLEGAAGTVWPLAL